ncbi:tryptophan-rich sensory protein [soil metagenome]
MNAKPELPDVIDQSREEQVRARKRNVLAGIGFVAATAAVATIDTLIMRGPGSPKKPWFRLLRKPTWQPPDRVFGPVWTALYATIAYSGYRIWKAPPSKQRSVALGLWATQLALNGAWTPLFFGARRPVLALGDIIALDAASLAYSIVASRVDKPAAGLVVPYLGWLGFATALNAKIVANNPSFMLER